MNRCSREEAKKLIQNHQAVTFLTGAGVSTPSGIPDYRSLKGVYHGIEEPEYLLSTECLEQEPDKFYHFVLNLYHPDAKPNVIHQKMAEMEQKNDAHIVTQNIDGLYEKAGSKKCVHFHGSLYDCHCRKCGQNVPWQEYVKSDRHKNCGGQIRPDIVLYGEGFTDDILENAVRAVQAADLVVVVGTSFQVHPFCDLIHYRKKKSEILVINQSEVFMPYPYRWLDEEASRLFTEL